MPDRSHVRLVDDGHSFALERNSPQSLLAISQALDLPCASGARKKLATWDCHDTCWRP